MPILMRSVTMEQMMPTVRTLREGAKSPPSQVVTALRLDKCDTTSVLKRNIPLGCVWQDWGVCFIVRKRSLVLLQLKLERGNLKKYVSC